MTTADLLVFIRSQHLAVQASRGAGETVQAALVGIAVTDAFELVFDSLSATRKVRNVRAQPHVAFVLGGWQPGDERTVQYEGVADEPSGPVARSDPPVVPYARPVIPSEARDLAERPLSRLHARYERSLVATLLDMTIIRVCPRWSAP
ncbi:MAG: hypothetical protein JWM41_723 [Gemmatimonadetes bacterium]|nr:hypothetical protein [Gemmatimonadota bacterium]